MLDLEGNKAGTRAFLLKQQDAISVKVLNPGPLKMSLLDFPIIPLAIKDN